LAWKNHLTADKYCWLFYNTYRMQAACADVKQPPLTKKFDFLLVIQTARQGF